MSITDLWDPRRKLVRALLNKQSTLDAIRAAVAPTLREYPDAIDDVVQQACETALKSYRLILIDIAAANDTSSAIVSAGAEASKTESSTASSAVAAPSPADGSPSAAALAEREARALRYVCGIGRTLARVTRRKLRKKQAEYVAYEEQPVSSAGEDGQPEGPSKRDALVVAASRPVEEIDATILKPALWEHLFGVHRKFRFLYEAVFNEEPHKDIAARNGDVNPTTIGGEISRARDALSSEIEKYERRRMREMQKIAGGVTAAAILLCVGRLVTMSHPFEDPNLVAHFFFVPDQDQDHRQTPAEMERGLAVLACDRQAWQECIDRADRATRADPVANGPLMTRLRAYALWSLHDTPHVTFTSPPPETDAAPPRRDGSPSD